MKRAILDTNVWSRIADADAGLKLRIAARAANVQIVATPSAAFELLRNPHLPSRSKALRLITEPTWTRLMPEAYLESQEFIRSVEKLRPHWLVAKPDRFQHDQIEKDWRRVNKPALRRVASEKKTGMWDRMRLSTDDTAAHLAEVSGEHHVAAIASAQAARRTMAEAGRRLDSPLTSLKITFEDSPQGWDGDAFDAWRAEAFQTLTYAFYYKNLQPYLDWILPFVDVERVWSHPPSWLRFWIYEVTPLDMPRQWIRSSFNTMQRFRRVGNGTPGDIQLSTYLPDGNVIFSTDRLFIELVEECRSSAPFPLAAGQHLPTGFDAVEALFEKLADV